MAGYDSLSQATCVGYPSDFLWHEWTSVRLRNLRRAQST